MMVSEKILMACPKNEETHRHKWKKHGKTKRDRRLMEQGWKICNRCGTCITPDAVYFLDHGKFPKKTLRKIKV